MPDIIDPLIPPYRFERAQNYLYRGGYPKPRNFRFLRRQRLKTILSLIPGDRDHALSKFCESEGIARIIIHVDSPNENVTVTDTIVSQCLELVTDPARAPLYIHCLDGSNVTGVVIMCLRKLQLWRVASYQNEYLRYEQDGEIIPEESEFVESYTGKGLVLPNPYVQWLWPRLPMPAASASSSGDSSLPFQNGIHPVMRHVKLKQRMPTDICLAEPLASFGKSATLPALVGGHGKEGEQQQRHMPKETRANGAKNEPASPALDPFSEPTLVSDQALSSNPSGLLLDSANPCGPGDTSDSVPAGPSRQMNDAKIPNQQEAQQGRLTPKGQPPALCVWQRDKADATKMHMSLSTGALAELSLGSSQEPSHGLGGYAAQPCRPLSIVQEATVRDGLIPDTSSTTATPLTPAMGFMSSKNTSEQNTPPVPRLGETWRRIHYELRRHFNSQLEGTRSSSTTPEPAQALGQNEQHGAETGDGEAVMASLTPTERSERRRKMESVDSAGSSGVAGAGAGIAFAANKDHTGAEQSGDVIMKEVTISLLVNALAIEGLGM
ncbi:protein-tyrosine-phosphatase [Dipsacomyces acuminosporus]|nr:protein-tyrosine-phosphatase [Dipsacomyces acuminosporus]